MLTTYAVQFGLTGLASILITRSLGPEGRGAYAVLLAIATTTMIVGNLSIEPAHVSLWHRAGDRGAIAANSVLLGPALGIAAVGGAVLVVAAAGPGVVPVPGYGLLAIVLAAVPFGVTVQYLNSVLTLRARIETVNRGVMLGTFVYAGSLTLWWCTGRLSLPYVVALWALHSSAPLAVLVPAARPRPRDADPSFARHAIGVGLRYHPGQVSRYLLSRVDVLILNALTDNAAVGIYSLAVTLVEMTRVLADTVAQIVLPGQVAGETAAAAALTARAARLSVLLSLGGIGVVAVAAPVAIPVVYGAAFGASVGPLLVLAPGLLALGATRPVGSFLLRLDRPYLMSAINMAALATDVALNMVLIPAHGVAGCALASTVAYCVLAALQAAWFARATGTPVRALLPAPGDVRYLLGTARRLARSYARLG